jgi:TnpA family transposase
MSSIHETAYPRFKPELTERELEDIYTPTQDELAFAYANAHALTARLAILVLLKTAQHLGYFIKLSDAPPYIVSHIAKRIGTRIAAKRDFRDYDQSGFRQRFLELIRCFMDIKPITSETNDVIWSTALQAAESKQVLADIINVIIEELVRQRYELPGFSTLVRTARRARKQVNDHYFRTLYDPLASTLRQKLDALLAAFSSIETSGWLQLKQEPKKPTNPEFRRFLKHVQWLKSWALQLPTVSHIPVPKYRQYVLEARALDAADMKDMKPAKRYALMVILVHAQLHRSIDDTADIFIRKVRKLHTNANEKLDEYHLEHQKQVEKLVVQLRDMLQAFQKVQTDQERGAMMAAALRDEPAQLLVECEEHMAYASNNYFPFMLESYRFKRSLLFNCISLLEMASTTSDHSLTQAIQFVLKHRQSHKEHLQVLETEINLHWLPDKWKRLVIRNSTTDHVVTEIHKKYFELCVLTEVSHDLQSGDLFVEHSDKYNDHRTQLIDWETYNVQIVDYGKMVSLPIEPPAFVAHMKNKLSERALRIDKGFLENQHVDIEASGLIIRKHANDAKPPALDQIDGELKVRMPEKSILDILIEAESWLDLHKLFGPLSGFDAKIDDPRKRFITTLFCYGCNLGPMQTARSVKGLSRKQVAWLNLHHMTEERLEKAIEQVINAYNKFLLPRYWGTGKHASADGTKWNLYEQNLLSEYHIRYGGYGGIGYYHVSDMYIALFSHFIPCGVYEAIYILDGLIKNTSDIQPDTLHGDTQAQNLPVFGLAFLLSIDLMPRIRDLKKLIFFRPEKTSTYEHINGLFSDSIDWQLIETHVKDMFRIVLSIKAGKITPSAILRRLGTASRKNKLYFAFRELGRVVRTMFLLDYIGSVELRKVIHAATNKSEEFNNFLQWLFFGGEGIIAENVRHEQQKIVKYNQLVANLVILHNVEAMTRTLKSMQEEGYPINEEILAGFAPYRVGHINRFGDYPLDMDRDIPPIDYNISFF